MDNKIAEDFKNKLEEKLDAMFPKGECSERGAAIVLFVEAIKLFEDACNFQDKYGLGDIVVVDDTCIGVIVKSWFSDKKGYSHDVYVRSYNGIKTYKESEIQRYIFDKEIDD